MKLTKQNGLTTAAGEAIVRTSMGWTGFQYSSHAAAWEALTEGNADAEAASIAMLLRKKQFDFGYHNKMHRKSRYLFRIRFSGSNADQPPSGGTRRFTRARSAANVLVL